MQRRRVLVVDDHKDVVQFLAGLLRKAGYTILIAMDAAQAVMQAHREVADVILTDITMPAAGGFTVLERLRQSTRTMQIPILVLTGTDDSDLESRALTIGARRVLRKPCDNAALPDAIKTVVEERG